MPRWSRYRLRIRRSALYSFRKNLLSYSRAYRFNFSFSPLFHSYSVASDDLLTEDTHKYLLFRFYFLTSGARYDIIFSIGACWLHKLVGGSEKAYLFCRGRWPSGSGMSKCDICSVLSGADPALRSFEKILSADRNFFHLRDADPGRRTIHEYRYHSFLRY